jgi:uncharacterized protein involved in exopolysaccharide biosynthesis
LAQYDINLREYWRILKKRKFVVISIAIVLGTFSTAVAILRAPTPLYTTVCSVEFEEAPSVEGVYGTTAQSSHSDEIETQTRVIKGYAVFQKVAEKLRLIPRGALKEDGQLREDIIPIIDSLQSKVDVSRERWTSILNIMVTDSDAVFAQKLANAIALTYKEVHAEDQMRRTKEAIKYIGDQLEEVRGKLREAEEEFNRFSQQNELLSIDLQSEDLLARAKEVQGEIRSLQEDKAELQGVLQRAKKFIENPVGTAHGLYSKKVDNQYEATHESLVELLLKRETLLKSFTLKHPDVMAISHRIIENARKMVILLQLKIDDIGRKKGEFEKEVKKVEKKTKVLMDKKLEYDRLKRKVKLYNDVTVLLEKKNQEALIRRGEKPEEVKIVKPALLPTHPINPPKTVATGALGLIIGLILGIVIAFIVETFDTSLGAIEDVEETLGTQVLGIVPQADTKDVRNDVEQKYPGGMNEHGLKEVVNLISHFAPKSMMAESFRALRTNIQFKEAGERIRAIAVMRRARRWWP